MAFLKEYENLGELGKVGGGSDAQVYKVRHKELDYVRAVRLVKNRITDKTSKLYEDFIREGKYVLRLGNGAHPNIVRIYTPKITEAGEAFWEMDFIDGDTVEKFIAHNHDFIPVEEIKRCLLDIASALAYCHVDNYRFSLDRDKDRDLYEFDSTDGSKLVISDENRQKLIEKYHLIHNDIKSNNVMRRFDGNYILLDFSLSFGSDKKLSRGAFEGGHEYKAPEKWDKNAEQMTERTDIYSFGVMLYEMLAGQVPFPYNDNVPQEQANNEIRELHLHTLPPPIEPLRKAAYEAANPGETYSKDYPDWLEEVIMKCLEKQPEKRYTNGKELYEEVKPLFEQTNTVNAADGEELMKLKQQNKELFDELSKLAYEKQLLEKIIEKLVTVEKNTEVPVEKNAEVPNKANATVKNNTRINKEITDATTKVTLGSRLRRCFYRHCSYDKGVVINGVRWATRNVDKPGTFAKNPEDAGMFYQWNRKVGWSGKDPMVNSNGGTTWDWSEPTGNSWEKANDPSPTGWRVPTEEEFESLRNTTYVKHEWTTENGVEGYRYTDKATGASLFLPAAGNRTYDNGALDDADRYGHYWSSTPYGSRTYTLSFRDGHFIVHYGYRANGFRVRCVAE